MYTLRLSTNLSETSLLCDRQFDCHNFVFSRLLHILETTHEYIELFNTTIDNFTSSVD